MNLLKNTLILFTLISMLSCSSDSNDSSDESDNASGTITLSGDETSFLGTSLKVGKIIEGAEQTGTSLSITLLHENIELEDGEIVFSESLSDTFVIVVAEFSAASVATKTVSMSIVVNGEDYQFACTTPKVGDFTECGSGFVVDQSGNKVVFSNTTVINVDSDKILTLNGVITW